MKPDKPSKDATDSSPGRITRRDFVRSGAVAASALGLVPLLAACGGGGSDDGGSADTSSSETAASTGAAAPTTEGGTVTWASFGGAYNEALQAAFVDPFSAQTGIKVELLSDVSLAPLVQQLDTGNVLWDIAELTGPEYWKAVADGVALEPLNTDIVKTDNVPSYAVGEFGIEYAYFTNVMTWDERQIQNPPTSWAEFLDPARYDVKRSLYGRTDDSLLLEFALIADGVALDALYPLDVDRALKSLERLPADLIVWYESNQEVIQQLIDRETGLGMPPVGRVKIANEGGATLNFSMNEAGVTGDYLVVPQGAPNPDGAWQLINFIVNDGPAAAAFMTRTGYGISNLKGVEELPEDIAATIPTSPALEGKIFFRDEKWWAANLEHVSEQFLAWQTSYSG